MEIEIFEVILENRKNLYRNVERAVVVQSLSCVRLFVTPWTAACQASLSFTISQSLLKLMSIESVMPSYCLILCHPILPLHLIFSSIRVLDSASALLKNIQGWFLSGLTSLTFLLSKGLLRVHSGTTLQKHQFFVAQPSLWSNSNICMWLLEKP